MADIANLTFLILDDIKSIRDQLKSQLRELGASKIIECENVAEGKINLANNAIHFIISDWNMPGESGFDFLKFVRSDAKYKNLPFMLLTTVGEEDAVLDAVMNGASNYLLKPWQLGDLKDKMQASYKKHFPGKVLI